MTDGILKRTKLFGKKKYVLYGMGYKETELYKSIKAYNIMETYFFHIVSLKQGRKDNYMWAMYVREKESLRSEP